MTTRRSGWLGAPFAAMFLLAPAPALPDDPKPAPDAAALVEDLIASVDRMLADLDAIIGELELAVAENPGDETLARLLAAYRADRSELAARRIELLEIRAASE